MKRLFALLTVFILILTFAGCSSGSTAGQSTSETKAADTTKETASADVSAPSAATGQTAEKPNNDTSNSSKTLVVYFSATGTTKGVAQQIASVAGADIYEIAAAQPYTSDDLNYNDSSSRTTAEQNDNSVRPAIAGERISLDGYDTIFIGYPIWWGEEPRIMDNFVESYDFSGKTVIPFCTSGGSGIGSSGDNLEANAGSGNWKEGRRFSAGVSRSDIEEWLNSL